MNKQERPYIFCHMETSLDGKIMGKYLWIDETNAEDDSFYALFAGENAMYKPQALLNGRITVEDNFTFYRQRMEALRPRRCSWQKKGFQMTNRWCPSRRTLSSCRMGRYGCATR